MPRQPVFERAPLMAAGRLAGRPGTIRSRIEAPAALLALLPDEIPDCCLEGAARLSACGYASKAEEAIRARIARQAEDGALPGDALALARAAWVLAEQTGDRELSEAVAAWLGWLSRNYEHWIADGSRRYEAADLLTLAVDFYRATGKRGALVLLSKLRKDAFDWATALGTFSLTRPMLKAVPPEEAAAGLADPDEEKRAYCQMQRVVGQAVTLADGMRATLAGAIYSGSGTGLEACRRGWERISRAHGAACGGTTADPMLEGGSPYAAIDPAAVGAWAEALAAMAEASMDWAVDPLEQIAENALSACSLVPGKALRVNAGDGQTYGPLAEPGQALGRLLRGWAAVLSTAVTAAPTGMDVLLLLLQEGVWACPLGEGFCRIQTAWQGDQFTLRLRTEKEGLATLRIRVPAWAENVTWRLNGGEAEAAAPGEYQRIERMWQDGDRIELSLNRKLRVQRGYHQSETVWLGAELMALETEGKDCGILALAGEPGIRDGEVTAALQAAEAGKTADMPVLPPLKGEPVQAVLRPFAAVKTPVAVFAGRQA